MIFELAQDFHDAVAAMPRGHPKHRMFELLEEAIRRDIHFIARHPTTLFQQLVNQLVWAAKFYPLDELDLTRWADRLSTDRGLYRETIPPRHTSAQVHPLWAGGDRATR